MKDIPLKILTTIEAYQILGVEYTSPDFYQLIGLIDTLINQHKNKERLPVYIYSHADKLRLLEEDKDVESNIIKTPPLGKSPTLHYLSEIAEYPGRGIFILLDLSKEFYNDASKSFHPAIPSYIRSIASNRNKDKKVIFLSEKINVAPDLLRIFPVINIPLPNLESRINTINNFVEEELNNEVQLSCNDIAIAAAGLSQGEIEQQMQYFKTQCNLEEKPYTSSGLQIHINKYKTELLRKLKVEVSEPKQVDFGGHENLKLWLDEAYALMQPSIAEYGLPRYKGCLLGGVSGCGKTLVAETIAAKWNLPLIKLSIPALKGGLVGQSENNLKNALAMLKGIYGVLLIDEVEKAMAGLNTDSSGVSGGMVSILLDYMNAQDSQFIIATANNVKKLPSELLRAGRLNERWFVGLPGEDARLEIFKIHLYKDPRRITLSHRQSLNRDLKILVDKTEGFSGAEIAEIVLRGLTSAVLNQRPQKPLLCDFTSNFPVPLSVSHPERFRETMEWAKNARHTSNNFALSNV